jgi:hypothetical protein
MGPASGARRSDDRSVLPGCSGTIAGRVNLSVLVARRLRYAGPLPSPVAPKRSERLIEKLAAKVPIVSTQMSLELGLVLTTP